jgi:hypothetical protein
MNQDWGVGGRGTQCIIVTHQWVKVYVVCRNNMLFLHRCLCLAYRLALSLGSHRFQDILSKQTNYYIINNNKIVIEE